MKTHPGRATLAFTLIELITVIAIICILMALLGPHLSTTLEAARRQEATTVLRSAVNAANNYKNDYGQYPPIAAAEDKAIKAFTFGDTNAGKCRVDNGQLFDVLRAIDRPAGPNQNHALNSRQSKYFAYKKATDARHPREGFLDGQEFNPEQAGQLLDPWGAQYCFVLENDGDDQVAMDSFFQDLAGPANVIRFSACAFSMGKDNRRGGPGYPDKYRLANQSDHPDDLVSWQ